MVFCDIADQNADCVAADDAAIQSIAQLALREGGQVYVNGQLVVFNNGGSSNGGNNNRAITSGTSVITVTGQKANDAANIGGGMFAVLGAALAGAVFFF